MGHATPVRLILVDAHERLLEGALDLAKRVVRSKTRVVSLGREGRGVTHRARHGFVFDAAILRELRERRPERLEREAHVASLMELVFELEQHGVVPGDNQATREPKTNPLHAWSMQWDLRIAQGGVESLRDVDSCDRAHGVPS